MAVESDRWVESGRADVFFISTNRRRSIARGYGAVRRRKPDIIYLNGFFNTWFSIVPQLLWRIGFWGRAVRLLAPRGEFGPGALSRRAFKKRTHMTLFRALRLHRRVWWHASSEQELIDIQREWGKDANVIVRENETSLPPSADPALLDSDVDRTGSLAAVFIGRIVEHKGLSILLTALASVQSRVTLDVYGTEEDAEYYRSCIALTDSLPKNVQVEFHGPLNPDDVRDAFKTHEISLLPTAGENFGHVIAEALSVSCPVMTTASTPWTDALRDGGGVIVESRDPEKWAGAIEQYGAMPPSERLGRRTAAERTYNAWRQANKGPHVFELLVSRLESQASDADPSQ